MSTRNGLLLSLFIVIAISWTPNGVEAQPPGYGGPNFKSLSLNSEARNGTNGVENGAKEVFSSGFRFAIRGCTDQEAGANNGWNESLFYPPDFTRFNKIYHRVSYNADYRECKGGGLQAGVSKEVSVSNAIRVDQFGTREVSAKSSGSRIRRSFIFIVRRPIPDAEFDKQNKFKGFTQQELEWVGDLFFIFNQPDYAQDNSGWDGKGVIVESDKGSNKQPIIQVTGGKNESVSFAIRRGKKFRTADKWPLRVTMAIVASRSLGADEKATVNIQGLLERLEKEVEDGSKRTQVYSGKSWSDFGFKLSDRITRVGVTTEKGDGVKGDDGFAEFTDIKLPNL
jgi:hypothetical protein